MWKLSEDEKDALKDLTNHPGFKLFLERIYAAELHTLRQVTSSKETHEVFFNQGEYYGLARARRLLEHMIDESKIMETRQLELPDIDPTDEHRRDL